MRKAFLVALLLTTNLAFAENSELKINEKSFREFPATAEILMFGAFHFANPGLDSYKPEVDIDVFSTQRQTELEDVLQRIITKYKPTKIAVEARGDGAKRVADRYAAYLKGEYELGSNEIYQIAFRLGKRLGHEKLFSVDVLGRSYENLPEDVDAYAKAHNQSKYMDNTWHERFMAMYKHEDYLKAESTLREIFLQQNTPERILVGHGHYLLGDIALGTVDEYPAADHVTGWWYNRNLRIFGNIRRMTEKDDRIFLLIGSGHLPIIRHAALASPEYAVVEVSEILGD